MTKVKPSATGHHFMVSPLWDLAFVINVPWVLVVMAHLLFLDGWFPDVDNFRYLFLTLPHRFITLALVFLDRDKFFTRPVMFVSLPLGFTALILLLGLLGTGVFLGTSTMICFLTIDYLWNTYHFAAQHYGVTRIYARKAGSGQPKLEKTIIISTITWCLLRAPNWTLFDGQAQILFTVVDFIAVPALLSLVVAEIFAGIPSVPKLWYVMSVVLLYGGVIVAPYIGLESARHGLLIAASFFHSVEYLAIVHVYMKGKLNRGGFRAGPFRMAAPIWSKVIVPYALVVGTLALIGMDAIPREIWMPFLAVASLCHYAYDGMIWKLRKPAVSQAFGAKE